MAKRLAAIAALTAALGCHLQFGVHDTPHVGPPLERVAAFETLPTTIALSNDGRLFVNFPNFFAQPDVAVAIVGKKNKLTPYPDARWNNWDGEAGQSAKESFVSVQALYVDRCSESLWIVDTGNPLRVIAGTVEGGPKLVEIDLKTNAHKRTIHFDAEIAPADSYLNDVRVDHVSQTAYLTESGMGALIVVDLKTNESRRVLAEHASTQAEDHVVPMVGGKTWRTLGGMAPRIHADGLALSPDRQWLYYHAVTGRTLYRVPTAALRNAKLDEAALGSQVEDLGNTGAVDGIWMDRDGSLYMTAIEHDAIERRRPDGTLETIVRDGLIQWPDAVVVHDVDDRRYVYFSASQIHKRRVFNSLIETRTTPYEIFRVPMVESGLPRTPVEGCPIKG